MKGERERECLRVNENLKTEQEPERESFFNDLIKGKNEDSCAVVEVSEIFYLFEIRNLESIF